MTQCCSFVSFGGEAKRRPREKKRGNCVGESVGRASERAATDQIEREVIYFDSLRKAERLSVRAPTPKISITIDYFLSDVYKSFF